jgi:hypothetical protein
MAEEKLSNFYAGGGRVPSGTEGEGGAIPSSGEISLGDFHGAPAPAYISATGGTITTDGDYKIHTFTSSGTFTVTAVGNAVGSDSVDYLVAAGGGGGGGAYYTGGGGGGGAVTDTDVSVSATSYTITIGGGGAGGTTSTAGSNGGNTTAFSQTGIGGGRGGANIAGFRDGANGGCGGGENGNGSFSAGVGSQGFDGATTTTVSGGGGGGMGSAGLQPSSTSVTSGGSGLSTTIRGTTEYYCAGGGGYFWGSPSGYQPRASGVGGRGACGSYPSPGNTANTSEMDAIVNTGSGGGGSDQRNTGYTRAGNGSGGIVIIRYKFQN